MRVSGTHLKKVLFALLLLGLALVLLVRHRRIEEEESLRWYDRTLILVTAPAESGITIVRDTIRKITGRYIYLVGVERENEDLRKRIDGLKTSEMLHREVERENERLHRDLDLEKHLTGEWVVARVVAYPPIGPYRILTVDKGFRSGIRRRAPVVSTEGLVGQVARVMQDESQVLLITDPTSAVDARTESGARGLVVGKRIDGTFEYLNRSEEIEEGAGVATSGLDGVYPAGISIGRVQDLSGKAHNLFQQVQIAPAVDFYKLREVLILK